MDEVVFLDKNRQIRYGTRIFSPIKDYNNEITMISVVGLDITERKQVEESLRKSEGLYKCLVESSNEAITMTNIEGGIQFLNKTAASYLGGIPEDYVNRTLWDIYPKEIADARMSDVLEVFQSGKGHKIEITLPFRGKTHHFIMNRQPIWNDAKEIVAVLSLATDITELKLLQNRLRRSQKLEAVGKLAGGIAHDFNNILYIITGNAELAMEEIPEQDPVYINLKEIKTAGLRGADIVRQIMNFSRSNDKELKSIDAIAVIRNTVNFLRASVAKNIEVRQQLPETEKIILGNPTQLRQALINLCINASQVMETTGGILDIVVENIILDETKIEHYPELKPGDYIKITVRDTGPGIEPLMLNRIFEPYFSTRQVGKGSGMGLAVVYGIVKNHKGVIVVESQLGEGTTFTLFFPMVSENAESSIRSTSGKLRRARKRILFIDDEPSIVQIGKKMLESLGYSVHTETSPAAALEVFRSESDAFDLVVTDMTMPNMTGDILARRLFEIRPDIPVIVCTGFSEKIDTGKAASIGIKGFLMKPVAKSHMAKTVRNVLENAEAAPKGP